MLKLWEPDVIAAKFEVLVVRSESGCWEWAGGHNEDGYSLMFTGVVVESAHRVSYVLTHGEIPDTYVVDHTCQNHGCVNPGHLTAITNKRNMQRGRKGRSFFDDGACSNGHLREFNWIEWRDACRACLYGVERTS